MHGRLILDEFDQLIDHQLPITVAVDDREGGGREHQLGEFAGFDVLVLVGVGDAEPETIELGGQKSIGASSSRSQLHGLTAPGARQAGPAAIAGDRQLRPASARVRERRIDRLVGRGMLEVGQQFASIQSAVMGAVEGPGLVRRQAESTGRNCGRRRLSVGRGAIRGGGPTVVSDQAIDELVVIGVGQGDKRLCFSSERFVLQCGQLVDTEGFVIVEVQSPESLGSAENLAGNQQPIGIPVNASE